MKVLFITHEASRSGAPIALLQELRRLRTHYQDIDFELLALRGGELMSSFLELCLVHKGWFEISNKYRLLNKVLKKIVSKPYLFYFKKGDFDCIYANTVASLKAANALKRQLDVPLLAHIHESECLMHALNVSSDDMLHVDSYITVSELAANNLFNNYGIQRHCIKIQFPISALIENYLTAPPHPHYLSFHDGSFIIGLFCNGGWYKSTELIPIIIKSFVDRYPEAICKYVIIGNIKGEVLYRLKYDLRKLHLLQKIIFIGEVEDPMNYYYSFDVLLLASREESFSLAAQEAAFMGKPIIAFENSSGAAEWIKDEAGILVPYLDFGRMADAIYKFYIDREACMLKGTNARKIFFEMYDKNYLIPDIISEIRKYGNKFES